MAADITKRIRENKQAEARAAFIGYVQSVAFNLTLSRNMVDALWAVREFGTAYNGNNASIPAIVRSRSVPLMKALERRGLVWHDYLPPKEAPSDHAYHKLTSAGELVCDLLVEAGLIAAKTETRKRKSA